MHYTVNGHLEALLRQIVGELHPDVTPWPVLRHSGLSGGERVSIVHRYNSPSAQAVENAIPSCPPGYANGRRVFREMYSIGSKVTVTRSSEDDVPSSEPATINESTLVEAFEATRAHYLGRGTFAVTWCVEGIAGHAEPRAVKVLQPNMVNPRRLKREVEGLSRFDSPGIMKLFEVRTLPIDGIEHTTLICEYIAGGDLRTKMESTPPSYAAVKKLSIGLLRAVKELHDGDTWHRDIKPANILLRDGKWGRPVLIDFGLVRASTDATMTQYPAQMGTLAFMAPEALRGEPARKLADLWSCGVVMYELLAGRHPFISSYDGLLPDDLVDLVVGDPFPIPGNVPADLRDVVLRLLSQSAHARGSATRALADLTRTDDR